MKNELEFCVKNLSTGETLVECSRIPELDGSDGMWVVQVYAFGDMLEGDKFTCQVLSDKRYSILIHSDFTTVAKTDYVLDDTLKLQYDHDDGYRYFFAARRKPQQQVSLFERLLSKLKLA